MAYTMDLKSINAQALCGFKSRSRHHLSLFLNDSVVL